MLVDETEMDGVEEEVGVVQQEGGGDAPPYAPATLWPTPAPGGATYAPELLVVGPDGSLRRAPAPPENSPWYRMIRYHARVTAHGMHAIAKLMAEKIRPHVYDGADVTLCMHSPVLALLGVDGGVGDGGDAPMSALTNSHDQLSALYVLRQCFVTERMREMNQQHRDRAMGPLAPAEHGVRVGRATRDAAWERARTLDWLNGELAGLAAASPEARAIDSAGRIPGAPEGHVSPLLARWAAISHQYAVRRCWEVERFIITYLGLDWAGSFRLGATPEENALLVGQLLTPHRGPEECVAIARAMPALAAQALHTKLATQQALRTAYLIPVAAARGWHIRPPCVKRPSGHPGGATPDTVVWDDPPTLSLKGLRFQLLQWEEHMRGKM